MCLVIFSERSHIHMCAVPSSGHRGPRRRMCVSYHSFLFRQCWCLTSDAWDDFHPARSTCQMSYSPPQLPLTGPSILVHIFSFSSTPLSYHGVARRTPTASRTAPSRSAGHAPTTAPSQSCSSASQGHARCGSFHTQSLPAAGSTSAARTATPGGQGRNWGVGARRCGFSPRLGVVLRCPWPLAATVVVRRQRLSAR
jgi:hypothetical protein